MDGRPFMRGGPRPPPRHMMRNPYPMRGMMRGAPPRMGFPDSGPRPPGMMRPRFPPFMSRGGMRPRMPPHPPGMMPRPMMHMMGMNHRFPPRGPRPMMPRPEMQHHDVAEMDMAEYDGNESFSMVNGNVTDTDYHDSSPKSKNINNSFRSGFSQGGQNRGCSNQKTSRGGGRQGAGSHKAAGMVSQNTSHIVSSGIVGGGGNGAGSVNKECAVREFNIAVGDDEQTNNNNNNDNQKAVTQKRVVVEKLPTTAMKKKPHGGMQQKLAMVTSTRQVTQQQAKQSVGGQYTNQQQKISTQTMTAQSFSRQQQQSNIQSSSRQQQTTQSSSFRQQPYQKQQPHPSKQNQPTQQNNRPQHKQQTVDHMRRNQTAPNFGRGTSNLRGDVNNFMPPIHPAVGRGISRPLLLMMGGHGTFPPVVGGLPPPAAMSAPFPGIQQQNAFGPPMMGPPAVVQQPSQQCVPPVAVKRALPVANASMSMNKRVRYDHPPQQQQHTATNGYQQFQPSPMPMQPQQQIQSQFQPQIQPQHPPQQSVYAVYESAPQQDIYTQPQINGPPTSQVYGVVNAYSAPQQQPEQQQLQQQQHQQQQLQQQQPQQQHFSAASTVSYSQSTSQYAQSVPYSSSTSSYPTAYNATTGTVNYDTSVDYAHSLNTTQQQPTATASIQQQSVDYYGYSKALTGSGATSNAPPNDGYGFTSSTMYTPVVPAGPAAPVYESYSTTTYVDPNTTAYSAPVQDTSYGQSYAAYTY